MIQFTMHVTCLTSCFYWEVEKIDSQKAAVTVIYFLNLKYQVVVFGCLLSNHIFLKIFFNWLANFILTIFLIEPNYKKFLTIFEKIEFL